ncbi:HD domain-containing protein [Staphylococcus caeli]|uniref:HD domain-containing protein n=1 Tax=Staphylococcus caeli TaxID=2201815 RepID=UPI003F5633DD
MNNEERLSLAYDYMHNFHKKDATGHDVAHVNRVLHLATYIAQCEGVPDLLTIKLASLLHDTVDHKLTDVDQAMQRLTLFLQKLNLSVEQQQHILHIIQYMSYSNGNNNAIDLSIEGQIVRDADRLDAIGAIGIARTFQFAGHFGEPMWIENDTQSIDNNTISHYDDWAPSAVKHFYEKLFKLKDLMHTPTAKQLAEQRHQFMRHFINQFFDEWYFER